jgi:hypothetical protein
VHVAPLVHDLLHEPQYVLLLVVSTQLPPHEANPEPHWQKPFKQVKVLEQLPQLTVLPHPSGSTPQVWPVALQFLAGRQVQTLLWQL